MPLQKQLRAFFASDAAAGIVLMAVAAAALILANSPWAAGYYALFHAPMAWSPLAKLDTLHLWINDAAMAVFFFVVGLEIKREVLAGELAAPAQRRLPVLAAAAGMAVPALIYLLAGGNTPELRRGWAIPAATDIAFAVGVIGLLGERVPRVLRLFLLTVAIVDDLGAVAIIALVYTAGLDLAWLGASLVVLGLLALCNRRGVGRPAAYAAGAAVLWLCVLNSGVHPTVAGVAAALTVPLRLDAKGDSTLLRMEHALVPWSAFLVVPLFGFANAGVALSGATDFAAPLPLAIALGLLLGKQAGIFAAIALADRSGFAARPPGTTWAQIWGVSVLCGIGFTMSLFIAALAFPGAPALVEEAKLGVLAGSLASALLGYAVLRLARK